MTVAAPKAESDTRTSKARIVRVLFIVIPPCAAIPVGAATQDQAAILFRRRFPAGCCCCRFSVFTNDLNILPGRPPSVHLLYIPAAMF